MLYKSCKLNHKTLFLLDLTSNFLNKSSEQSIEFDVFTKNRSTPAGIIPLAAICKSLWTCTVESVLEYSRIIWDLFSENDKLLSFIAFKDNGIDLISNWSDECQSMSYLNNAFAKAGLNTKCKPNKNENNLISSITDCIDSLATFTPLQWKYYKSKKEISNKGRLILITSFQNNNQVNNFIKNFTNCLNTHNKNLCNQSFDELNETSKLSIKECHLVIINTYPVNLENVKVTEIEMHNITPIVTCEIFNFKSGTHIAAKMLTLLLNHYQLTLTTVTGIPMKEEQNASSSATYDVEIVHSNKAHVEFLELYKSVEQINMKTTYDTVSLKWCTPKGSSVELHQCTGAYRITAVDVNSRPSSCLINFLLSGRTVMLEMPKFKGKCMSHMLSSHCGELYIHALGCGKSMIDDPPSISEGTGGRVTDYRINEFGDLMKSVHLERCKIDSNVITSLEKAKKSLMKKTLYWTLTIGHSIIFNLANQIQPLLTLIPQETLTQDEVNECQNALYQLVAMENKSLPLPVPAVLPKSKGIKKEELYKLLWKELEYFIEKHSITPEHNKVLSCLKDLNTKYDTSKENVTSQNFSIIDDYNNMTEKEKSDVKVEVPEKKPRMNFKNDSSMNKMLKKSMMTGNMTLLGLFSKRLELENNRKGMEFKGRQNGNNIAQLYTSLTELKPENPL